jgi:hypothetical protein
MPYDGNGNFNRVHNWISDATNGLDINATEMDQEDNGFAAGLSNCVTRDGQGKMTVDFLPNVDNVLNLGSGAFRWASINGTPISNFVTATQASIGALLYPRTNAEVAAGVTPTNYAYAPGDCRRYGAATTDATGSTNLTAINNALSVANNTPGGGVATLPGGNFNINGLLTGYTNTYLAGQGMGMGQAANPDFTNGGTSITQLSVSADVINFPNANSCGLRDISIVCGSGGNGIVWSATGSNQISYFQLQNVSVNLGANSAGIGIWLNCVGASSDLYFPRFQNVTVTGQSEVAYGTKIGIRVGTSGAGHPVVYGDFSGILVNGVNIGLDLPGCSQCVWKGVTLYNISGTGSSGIGVKGTGAGNNYLFGLMLEQGTIDTYINWNASSNLNVAFLNDTAIAPAKIVDAGTNNQYFGDDGSGGFTNKFGVALNLFDVRSLKVGGNLSPAGTALTLYAATTATVNPGAIAANTTSDSVISIPGVLATDKVVITPQSAPEAGIMWSVSAVANGVTIRLANVTTGSITPASRTYNIAVFR